MGLLLETQDVPPARLLLIPVLRFCGSLVTSRCWEMLLGPMVLDLPDRHPSALTGIFPGAA